VVAASIAPLAYFTFLVPSMSARIVTISAATAALLLPSALVLLRPDGDRDRMVRWLVAAAYLLTGLFMASRAVVTPFMDAPGQDFMALANPIHTLGLVFGIGSFLVLGIGLPLLVSGRMQQRLVESERRFSAVFNACPDAIALVRLRDSIITDVNPAYLAMHELARQEVIGHTGEDSGSWQKLADRDEVFAQLRRTGHVQNFLYRFRRKSGTSGDALISADRVQFDGEDYSVAVISDISELIKTRAALQERDATYRVLFESSVDALSIIDPETGCYLDCNPAAVALHGAATRESLIGISPDKLSPEYQPDGQRSLTLAIEHLNKAAGKEAHSFEWTHSRVDGTTFPVQVSLCPIDLAGKRRVLAIARDISERKDAERRVHQLAFFDSLTNLPNRRMLLDRLQHGLAQAKRFGRPLAVMFLDLDRFKNINDSLGHNVGDSLLAEVATRLQACVRAGDTVSRPGGDEFVVVLPEIADSQAATIVAEKIIEALGRPMLIGDHLLDVTISIGIAIYDANASDGVVELMKKADIAMYAAKQAGRNCYRFYEQANA